MHDQGYIFICVSAFSSWAKCVALFVGRIGLCLSYGNMEKNDPKIAVSGAEKEVTEGE